MRQVKVLGSGCSNCRATLALVERVALARGVAVNIEKVEDPRAIAAEGVLATPAVLIDGRLVHAGGVPAQTKVESWFGN